MRSAGALVAAVTLAGGVGRALRTLGATAAEVAAPLPGDDALPAPGVTSTRAVGVAAPPAAVWPWLVQLGWGRGGWYAVDALERLVGAARSVDAAGRRSWRSVEEIVPAHQHLAVGDRVPLSADLAMTVVALEAGDHLVLWLDERLRATRLRWAWTFALRADGTGGTRLLARTRITVDGAAGPLVEQVLLDPGHAVMEVVQLRGIRRRAEAAARWAGAT